LESTKKSRRRESRRSEIQEETDAVLRLTTAAICGSDLHMYEGRAPMEPGIVFGHAVRNVKAAIGSSCRFTSAADFVSIARVASAMRA